MATRSEPPRPKPPRPGTVRWPHGCRQKVYAGRLSWTNRTDGRPITETEGRKICADRHKIEAATRAARRNGTQPKRMGRRGKESTKAAPAAGPSNTEPTEKAA